MVDAVINIVNRARGRASQTPLQPAAFDASFERGPLTDRNEFTRIYKELADYKQEDFRTYFDVTTTAGVNEYTLTPTVTKFENDVMYIIDAGDDDIPIYYYTEQEILRQYSGDLSEIPSGKPYGFFIRTTSTAITKKLSFVDNPDATYTIRGYYYQDAAAMTGTSLTACGNYGDQFLEDHMYGYTLFSTGIIGYPDFQALKEKAKLKYLCQDFKTNTRMEFNRPHQHGAGDGFMKTRSGRAFV